MKQKQSNYHFQKLLRRYRRVQHRLAEASDSMSIRHLRRKLDQIGRRLLRLNRSWKMGIATSALLVWMTGPIQAQNFPASFFYSTLDGTNGFNVPGLNEGDYSGRSVSGAGDINGDGIDDLIIGAPSASPGNLDYAGESYVVFGSTSPFGASFDLSGLNGANGFTIRGAEEDEASGLAVSAAGDVNGDGIDDLIVGAPGAYNDSIYDAGATYVVFGRNSGFPSSLSVAALDGSNGFTVRGVANEDYSGWALSGGGDVNGDGIDDIIIGAPFAKPDGTNYTGAAYVIFGQNTGFSSEIDLASLNGSNGFQIAGVAEEDYAGRSVSIAGDVNDDGIDDVIIGANGVNNYAGAGYVVFGRNTGFAASLALSSLDGTNGFKISGISEDDYCGWAVSGVGDVNGDGIDDVMLGAPLVDPDPPNLYAAGAAYVVFGSDQGFSDSLTLSSLNGNNGFAILGLNESDILGVSVSGGVDVNEDGFPDMIMGAAGGDPDGNSSAGLSYVIFGGNSGFTTPFDLNTLDGSNGFLMKGTSEDSYSGWSVSGIGDFNGDGFHDLMVGAFYGNNYTGESYVVFGMGPPAGIDAQLATIPLSLSPNPTNGMVLLRSDALTQSSEVTIQLFDPVGRIQDIPIHKIQNGEYQLNMHGLSSGVYTIRTIADGEYGLSRIVKE